MRVKIGDTWYEAGTGQPIVVELTKQDRRNIDNMHPEYTKYCVYDTDEYSEDAIKTWMEAAIVKHG